MMPDMNNDEHKRLALLESNMVQMHEMIGKIAASNTGLLINPISNGFEQLVDVISTHLEPLKVIGHQEAALPKNVARRFEAMKAMQAVPDWSGITSLGVTYNAVRFAADVKTAELPPDDRHQFENN